MQTIDLPRWTVKRVSGAVSVRTSQVPQEVFLVGCGLPVAAIRGMCGELPRWFAGLILYLASEEAAFVTGANIAINGGQHMQ